MSDLAARSELARLRTELGADDDALAFLVEYHHDDVRALRHAAAEALAAPHRGALRRVAGASVLLPPKILAAIGQRSFGPYLCSKIAVELEPAQARKIVGAFSVPFLADLCRTLDPVAGAGVIQAISTRRAVAVGTELAARRDHDTLGRFVDVIGADVIPPLLGVLDDDALLEVAVVAEGRDRLDEIFGLVDDERILGVVDAAARTGAVEDLVVLLGDLGHDQSLRALEVVVAAGEPLLTDLVGAVMDLDGWDELLPVLVDLPPSHLVQLATAPALTAGDTFSRIVAQVLAAGDEVVDALLAVVAAMPEDRQRSLATDLARDSPAVAGAVLDAAAGIERAAALPAVVALGAALDGGDA